MTAAVEVRDLFCLYRSAQGDVAALRGLSLTVGAGERVVLHGPNGSGKTTLLRVLLGEQQASAGVVHIGGLGRIGYIEQHPARVLRPEVTVLDNVALQLSLSGMHRSAAKQRALAVLAKLDLDELADRRPGSLSGGEAQRVGVAAAVAHEPSLVLADEPTGALDRLAADAVYDLLADAVTATGAALLLVSHDEGAARVAERVVRMRDGRVSEQWHPGDADETLVIDDRGWVRLPEPMRRATGAASGVRAGLHGGGIQLTGTSQPLGASPRSTGSGSEVRSGRRRTQPAACAAGVRVDRSGRRVLDDFNLAVPPAALTVVQGRSGSGKSTVLRLLAGLDRPDAGRIVVDGTDLSGLDRDALADLRRARVAYSGQSAYLAEALDVVETVQIARQIRGLPPDDASIDRWLEDLDLQRLRGRQVRLLSGGERQRVAVARALAVGAQLVLADEPTAQLDEAHAELLAGALIEAARRGIAVVAASHDPVLVAAASQVHALA